jgi:hypothetical protein
MDRQLMAGMRLKTTAFRLRPGGLSAQKLHESNLRLGEAVIENRRVLVGTSMPGKGTICSPAFSNWCARARAVEE